MLDSSNLQQHKGSALLQEINTNSLFNSLQLRLWSATNICNLANDGWRDFAGTLLTSFDMLSFLFYEHKW